MATNVSEKDRILQLIDEYINELIKDEISNVYGEVVHLGNAYSNDRFSCKPSSYGDIEIRSLIKHAADGTKMLEESIALIGDDDDCVFWNPTEKAKLALYGYAGFHRAVDMIRRWISLHLGYSGDMPTEVPNQSERADS